MMPRFTILVGPKANSSKRADLPLAPLESMMSAAFIQYDIVNESAPKRDWNVVFGFEPNSMVSLTPSKDKDLVLEKETLAPEASADALAEASVFDKD